MIAADLLSALLVCGVLVLVVTTTIMIMGFLPAGRRSSPQNALSPGAAQVVAVARARASAASAELGIGTSRQVPGQVLDISDGRWSDRQMSVEDASALAAHFAETDPQRIAEVISQWIRSDSGSQPDAVT